MSDINVSIILATYNREQFIARAIENILNQTFKDFELIIINDCSTDNTKQICKKYKALDERISVINLEKNCGLSNARNLGVNLAKAEYITFVDDDDICETEMIEFLYNLANENDADISICGSVNDYGNRIEPLYVYDELLVLDKIKGLEEFLKREKFHTAPPTKLFKRKLFKNISFLSGVKIDDIHVMYKVFAASEKTVALGKPLYKWVKHENNISGFIETNKLKPQILDEYIMMQKQRVDYLSEKVPEIAERAEYAAWSYMISMCDKIKTYDCVDCEEQFNHMISILNNNLVRFMNSPFITEREKHLIEKYVV